MKKFIIASVFGLASLVGVSQAQAQATATPNSKLGFDQAASSLSEAQGFTYKSYANGSNTGVATTGLTCTGTASPFACQVNFPTFTAGSHTVQLTAGNSAGDSPKSASLSFIFITVPGAPTNLRVQ